MSWLPGDDVRPRVLVVCTANICRSPAAAAMLRIGAPATGRPLAVASAGFLEEGRPPDPTMVALAAQRGIDVGPHRSRVVDESVIAAADLVVTMERRHARELIVMAPELGHRVHTLVGLPAMAGDRLAPAADGVDDWLRSITSARHTSDLMGDRAPDEIPDPYGRSKRHYRDCLDRLQRATAELLRLFGP